MQQCNRFILVVFGDLKNYVYHYQFITLELDASHINQLKANKIDKVFTKTDNLIQQLTTLLLDESAD